MSYEPVKFLIVDDDEVSVMKVKRVVNKAKLENPIAVAGDGIEALEILRADGGREVFAKPYLVFLDINMPRMDGHEFLAEVRSDPLLKNVLVFMLTTSDNAHDVDAAYGQNVAGYLLKDNTEHGLIEKINMVDAFSSMVVMPR